MLDVEAAAEELVYLPDGRPLAEGGLVGVVPPGDAGRTRPAPASPETVIARGHAHTRLESTEYSTEPVITL